jgi:hypothetical protein
MGLEPVDGNVGEPFLKIVVHEVFGFIFGIGFAAGPAAEGYSGSGFFDIEGPAAGEAFFFYGLQEVYPLSFNGVKLK